MRRRTDDGKAAAAKKKKKSRAHWDKHEVPANERKRDAKKIREDEKKCMWNKYLTKQTHGETIENAGEYTCRRMHAFCLARCVFPF